MPGSIDLLSWNIQQGGYDRRHVFDDTPLEEDRLPERESAIKAILDQQRGDGVDTISLIDTYGWRQRYGDDEAIARHIGCRAATFVELGDTRVDRIYGPGAGSTFATDHAVDEVRPLDLDDRQGIRAIIAPDGMDEETRVQAAVLYLSDVDEEIRRMQLRAALHGLKKDMPAILTGDFNALRPDLEGASLRTKAQDLGFRALVFSLKILPNQETIDTIMAKIDQQQLAAKIGYYRQSLIELNKRELVPEIESRGYVDADQRKTPTFRKLGGIGLSVDYVFHTSDIRTDRFQVVKAGKASDHEGTRVRAYT
jgi:endonuclease/exonuclease/phosphatase family metal-dependent hydrolase